MNYYNRGIRILGLMVNHTQTKLRKQCTETGRQLWNKE